MRFDRTALKHRAVEIIRNSNRPKVITVGLVYLLLSVLVGLLSSRLLGLNYSEADAQRYLQYYAAGNYDYAAEYLQRLAPPSGSYIINMLLNIVMTVVSAGFVIFLLNTIRGNSPCFGNLLDGFGMFFKVIFLNIIEAVFISLWSMLFIFPGIVAFYRYSQAIYILIDNPEKSPMQCIRESKAMMRGHKNELFMLDLSLIGWYILSTLPVVGYGFKVWTVPYSGMIKALYYEYLCGRESYPGAASHRADSFNVDI